jgi:hypothetical protein
MVCLGGGGGCMFGCFFYARLQMGLIHSAHLGRFVAHLTSAVSCNAPLNQGYFQKMVA